MIQSRCSTSADEPFDLPEFSLSPPALSTEPSTSSPPKQSGSRMERPTECLVCGRSAHGYHYNVASCNGCKTFFRRMCLSGRSFSCKLDRDCFDLTKRKTPAKCRACRLQKCLSVGMDPGAMEVDKKAASSSTYKSLLKRSKVKEEDPDDCQIIALVSNNSKKPWKLVESLENKLQNTIDMLVYLESKVEKFRKSSYNPDWNEMDGLEFLLKSESRIGFADRYGPMKDWPLKGDQKKLPPPPPPSSAKFGGPKHNPDRKQWMYFNLFTTVEYAKTFMFFHRLDSRDKFILTKHVTLSCMNLHLSYTSVARKSEVLTNPDGTSFPSRTHAHYTSKTMSVAPLIRSQMQYIEYTLLKAICLCNPAVPDLSHHAQEILSKERETYADALFDYCLRTRNDGPSHFAQLMQIFDVLERQQKLQKDLHLIYILPTLAHAPKGLVIRVIEDIMES